MNDTSSLDALERRARRRVGLKLGWATHALVYVLVNAGLYVLDRAAGGEGWSRFPLWGWGLGLTIHGTVTLLALGSDGWRERLLAREMEALRRRG